MAGATSLAMGLATATWARDSTEDSTDASAMHRVGFGLQIGYGLGVAPRSRQRGRDVEDVRFVAVNPHVRMRLASLGSSEHWYHAELDGIAEASFLIETEPTDGWAGGLVLDLRYRLRPDRRLQPYAEFGLGVGYLQFGLVGQDDGLSFVLQAGGGARWRLDDRYSLIASVRWHHISNAQLRQPNNGIDDVLFVVGVELW